MSYSPQKADFWAFFSRGEHDNGQQFEQLIFIEVTLFFIEVFRWKKKKFKSKNLIHPSKDDYLLLKNQRGTWQRPRKILKILFYRGGTWQRGEYGKGYYGNILSKKYYKEIMSEFISSDIQKYLFEYFKFSNQRNNEACL